MTYVKESDKQASVPRGWYNRKAYRSFCDVDPKLRGVQCDEYPFYSTAEGGPGASLREVPTSDNEKKGIALRRMYADPLCEMQYSASGIRDFSGSGQAKYLVTPTSVKVTPKKVGALPKIVGPNSFHVCGGARTLSVGGGVVGAT